MINLAQVQEAFAPKGTTMKSHPVKGDDNFYIIFTSGTPGKPKGECRFHDNLLSATKTGILRKEFATPSRSQKCWHSHLILDFSVLYWAPTPWHLVTRFSLPSVITLRTKQLFARLSFHCQSLSGSQHHPLQICMLSEYFNSEKMPGITHFSTDGEELTVKTAQKLRERFPIARIINAYGTQQKRVALCQVVVIQTRLATLSNASQSATKRLILTPLSLTRKEKLLQIENREKSFSGFQLFIKVI